MYFANSGEPLHRSDYQRTPQRNMFSIRKETYLVSLGAYSLLPHQFHLLIHESTLGGTSKYMQKLLTSYTMYFNKKHQRSGQLFSGKFHAKQIKGDHQLKQIYAYIHLSPFVKNHTETLHADDRVRNHLITLPYSSMPDYLGAERPQAMILTPSAFPVYFEKPNEHLDQLLGLAAAYTKLVDQL
jgi:hypothetical protein